MHQKRIRYRGGNLAKLFFLVASCALAIIVLPSCGGMSSLAGRPDRSIKREAIIKRIDADARFHIDELVIKYHDASEDEKLEVRNLVIDVGMLSVDQHYSLFVDEFSSSRKGIDTVADIGSIATDAMATLFTPPGTKSILAAVSGGITASQVSISKNYFYEQTMSALIKSMEAQRRVVQTELIKGTGRSITAYPLSAAMADLERYYFAGTVDGAVAAIQQAAAEREQSASEEIKKIREDLDKTNAAALTAREWIRINGIAKAREKFMAYYTPLASNTSNAEKLAEVRATIIGAALNQLSVDEIITLLPDNQRAEAKGLLSTAGTTTATRRVIYSRFARKYGASFDFAKYINELSDEKTLGNIIGSFREDDILKLKQ